MSFLGDNTPLRTEDIATSFISSNVYTKSNNAHNLTNSAGAAQGGATGGLKSSPLGTNQLHMHPRNICNALVSKGLFLSKIFYCQKVVVYLPYNIKT